jgi:hypothetical protein
MNDNQQRVKYVKMFDSHKVYEVKDTDPHFEGQMVYFLETEPGLIEPYSERLIEEKFYSYAEMHAYVYGEGTDEDSSKGYELDAPNLMSGDVCSCGSPLTSFSQEKAALDTAIEKIKAVLEFAKWARDMDLAPNFKDIRELVDRFSYGISDETIRAVIQLELHVSQFEAEKHETY